MSEVCTSCAGVQEETICMGSEEKLLGGSNRDGMGPCPLPSRDIKALDLTLFCADGWFVVVRFVLHALIWAAVP